jgi:hypothetical protein
LCTPRHSRALLAPALAQLLAAPLVAARLPAPPVLQALALLVRPPLPLVLLPLA